MSILKDTKVGSTQEVNGLKLIVLRTTINHHCKNCYYFENGDGCPQGIKNPICFANERPDKQSVYFTKSREV